MFKPAPQFLLAESADRTPWINDVVSSQSWIKITMRNSCPLSNSGPLAFLELLFNGAKLANAALRALTDCGGGGAPAKTGWLGSTHPPVTHYVE